jgi:F-type H+-transporting ATPase subunit gamma
MPSAREIRRRIRSVKSTAQITRAMEMVSAVKMRRAQGSAVSGRPYSERILALLGGLVGRADLGELHPLLEQRPVERVAVVVITADRGLTGPLNANMIRETGAFLQSVRPKPVRVVTVGRRGRDWLARHGVEILADFSGLPDRPSVMDISPIARLLTDGYIAGDFDEVGIIYSRFQSTTVQRPQFLQLLPIEAPSTFGRHYADFLFEPDPAQLLGLLLPRFIEVEIYHALLEARASEHSARMVAMHNATQNANEVVQELTLSYNKARQSSITTEILEIASGAGALQGT